MLARSQMNNSVIGSVFNFEYPCIDSTECFPIEVDFMPGCYLFELFGASGGDGYRGNVDEKTNGGQGGYSIGSLDFHNFTRVYLFIGGKGITSNQDIIKGGYNGGGNGSCGTLTHTAGSGGGGTDIRVGCQSLSCRRIIAGGGGGAGSPNSGTLGTGHGGSGGGNEGINGYGYDNAKDTYRGLGGNQSMGGRGGNETGSNKESPPGELGAGGSIIKKVFRSGCGGGGGGYFGGGAGGASGGGGGSGYLHETVQSFCRHKAKTINGDLYSSLIHHDSDHHGKDKNGFIKITVLSDCLEKITCITTHKRTMQSQILIMILLHST